MSPKAFDPTDLDRKKPDNPPAFPTDHEFRDDGVGRVRRRGGMTLRDYFAGQAIIGCGAAESFPDVGAWAYKVADALIRERAKS